MKTFARAVWEQVNWKKISLAPKSTLDLHFFSFYFYLFSHNLLSLFCFFLFRLYESINILESQKESIWSSSQQISFSITNGNWLTKESQSKGNHELYIASWFDWSNVLSVCGIENECIQIAVGEKTVEKFMKKVKVEKLVCAARHRANSLSVCVCLYEAFASLLLTFNFIYCANTQSDRNEIRTKRCRLEDSKRSARWKWKIINARFSRLKWNASLRVQKVLENYMQRKNHNDQWDHSRTKTSKNKNKKTTTYKQRRNQCVISLLLHLNVALAHFFCFSYIYNQIILLVCASCSSLEYIYFVAHFFVFHKIKIKSERTE